MVCIVSLIVYAVLRRGFMKSLASRHYLLNEASSMTALDKPVRRVTVIYLVVHTIVVVVFALLLGLYFS